MGKLILFFLLGATAVATLFRPWIGVVASYLLIILRPQDIWWWNFQGTRAVFIILLPTIVRFCIDLLQGNLKFEILKNKTNLFLLILWFCFILSYFFGPYIGVPSSRWWREPGWTLSVINKIFVIYFIACFYVNDEKRLKYLTWVMIVSTIYLIYWANDQYFVYHRYGRIGGPAGLGGGSVYYDENVFAMLFVSGLPFLYYYGWYIQNKYFRYILWLIIPFGWHAIFLTGSRGGLLGLGVTLFVMAFRSPKRWIGFAIIPLFVVAYVWQAGSVMKQRAGTIDEYQTESSAEARLHAWEAAINMIKTYPITGVGLSAFGVAFQDFSDKQPREAHNTFLQIAAQSGIIAGLMYILVTWSSIKSLILNSKILAPELEKSKLLYLTNEAVLAALIGFFVCSMFLSLQLVEIFYFLCVLVNALSFLVQRFDNSQRNHLSAV